MGRISSINHDEDKQTRCYLNLIIKVPYREANNDEIRERTSITTKHFQLNTTCMKMCVECLFYLRYSSTDKFSLFEKWFSWKKIETSIHFAGDKCSNFSKHAMYNVVIMSISHIFKRKTIRSSTLGTRQIIQFCWRHCFVFASMMVFLFQKELGYPPDIVQRCCFFSPFAVCLFCLCAQRNVTIECFSLRKARLDFLFDLDNYILSDAKKKFDIRSFV